MPPTEKMAYTLELCAVMRTADGHTNALRVVITPADPAANATALGAFLNIARDWAHLFPAGPNPTPKL